MARRPATVDDIHEIARGLPGVKLGDPRGRTKPTVYQVSRRSFLFFRNPRPDAVDPETGERYATSSSSGSSRSSRRRPSWPMRPCPSSRRPHFDGHPSVLVRGSRIGEISRDELAGFVEGAWLSRAGPRAVAKWTDGEGLPVGGISRTVGVVARQEGGVALGEASLKADPIDVALVRLPDRAPIECAQAPQPRKDARRWASFAKGGKLDLELGHDGSKCGGNRHRPVSHLCRC